MPFSQLPSTDPPRRTLHSTGEKLHCVLLMIGRPREQAEQYRTRSNGARTGGKGVLSSEAGRGFRWSSRWLYCDAMYHPSGSSEREKLLQPAGNPSTASVPLFAS